MAPDCWNGEPVTCGPSVQTVSPCGNILVGHLFMPQFSSQFDIPVSSLDRKPHRAIILLNWTVRCRWTRLKGNHYSKLRSSKITPYLPLVACLPLLFPPLNLVTNSAPLLSSHSDLSLTVIVNGHFLSYMG